MQFHIHYSGYFILLTGICILYYGHIMRGRYPPK